MAKGCHDSPAAKGWILTSPCLWSCDQQHLGDVAEVADTSVMQCHVMLRCVMSCYVMLSYPWDPEPPLKPWGVNKIPPWIKLPKGFNHRIWGTWLPWPHLPRSSLVHAAGHGRWAVRPGVMHRWTWRWINIYKAPNVTKGFGSKLGVSLNGGFPHFTPHNDHF